MKKFKKGGAAEKKADILGSPEKKSQKKWIKEMMTCFIYMHVDVALMMEMFDEATQQRIYNEFEKCIEKQSYHIGEDLIVTFHNKVPDDIGPALALFINLFEYDKRILLTVIDAGAKLEQHYSNC